MLHLQTTNPLLLAEREKVKDYLLTEVLGESPLNSELIDDLINFCEVHFNTMEITEENILFAYSKIYAPGLKDALPSELLKEGTMRIVK